MTEIEGRRRPSKRQLEGSTEKVMIRSGKVRLSVKYPEYLVCSSVPLCLLHEAAYARQVEIPTTTVMRVPVR